MNLTGKRVVVTGGAGALGRAVVAKALALGAGVVSLDVVAGAGAPAAGEQRLVVDLTDAQAVRDCFARIGRVDALFNVAGGFAMGPTAWEVSSADWDAMFRINV
ncbi:MAG: SDR family NAD(P)-dependent oxidoreductase, partial [Gammaproteobacteria bacterium]